MTDNHETYRIGTMHRVKPQLTDRARQLRRDASFPERILWSRLRGRQLAGCRSRRQHPIGPYIADFCCADLALVIELDGETHVGRYEYDCRRTDYLRKRGFEVMRILNDHVVQDVDEVVERIYRKLQNLGAGLENQRAIFRESRDSREPVADEGLTLPLPLPKREGGLSA